MGCSDLGCRDGLVLLLFPFLCYRSTQVSAHRLEERISARGLLF